MRRGRVFHTFFVVLLAVQVLLPPSWVKPGLDCMQRCRLAATTGAHCPLRYGAQHATSLHHHHEQASPSSSSEWRCNCPHSSPSLSTFDVIRFVLPQRTTVVASVLMHLQFSHPVVVLGETCLAPPDPPPRPSLRILL